MTFRDIIDLWPSIEILASDIEEKPDTVRKWGVRNSIPPRVWNDLVTIGRKRGYKIAVGDLAMIAKDIA